MDCNRRVIEYVHIMWKWIRNQCWQDDQCKECGSKKK